MNDNVEIIRHADGCAGKNCFCLLPPPKIEPGPLAEYLCQPKIRPPFGRESQYLMHYYSNPSCLSPFQDQILKQFPKRISGKLIGRVHEPIEERGVYYQEGWNWRLIGLVILICFLVGSLVFGVSWWVAKEDIQGGFGAASWWVSVDALVLAFIAVQT